MKSFCHNIADINRRSPSLALNLTSENKLYFGLSYISKDVEMCHPL